MDVNVDICVAKASSSVALVVASFCIAVSTLDMSVDKVVCNVDIWVAKASSSLERIIFSSVIIALFIRNLVRSEW